ncbi:hypothetical protein HY629_02315 [Candidatus Uhrbacteria bacterium]|nr:hypothetical protein [Candidatus Uhrbacteria bacterium]
MNPHDHVKLFDALAVIAIIVGCSLVFSLVFSGVTLQTFDVFASSLEIFDLSEQWPSVVGGAKFPFHAMGLFYDEFYNSSLQVAGSFLGGISEYSEVAASAYSRSESSQQIYSGHILGTMTGQP